MANSYSQFTGQVSKDGRLEETLYMENALMQQPSHIWTAHSNKLFSYLINIYIEMLLQT